MYFQDVRNMMNQFINGKTPDEMLGFSQNQSDLDRSNKFSNDQGILEKSINHGIENSSPSLTSIQLYFMRDDLFNREYPQANINTGITKNEIEKKLVDFCKNKNIDEILQAFQTEYPRAISTVTDIFGEDELFKVITSKASGAGLGQDFSDVSAPTLSGAQEHNQSYRIISDAIQTLLDRLGVLMDEDPTSGRSSSATDSQNSFTTRSWFPGVKLLDHGIYSLSQFEEGIINVKRLFASLQSMNDLQSILSLNQELKNYYDWARPAVISLVPSVLTQPLGEKIHLLSGISVPEEKMKKSDFVRVLQILNPLWSPSDYEAEKQLLNNAKRVFSSELVKNVPENVKKLIEMCQNISISREGRADAETFAQEDPFDSKGRNPWERRNTVETFFDNNPGKFNGGRKVYSLINENSIATANYLSRAFMNAFGGLGIATVSTSLFAAYYSGVISLINTFTGSPMAVYGLAKIFPVIVAGVATDVVANYFINRKADRIVTKFEDITNKNSKLKSVSVVKDAATFHDALNEMREDLCGFIKEQFEHLNPEVSELVIETIRSGQKNIDQIALDKGCDRKIAAQFALAGNGGQEFQLRYSDVAERLLRDDSLSLRMKFWFDPTGKGYVRRKGGFRADLTKGFLRDVVLMLQQLSYQEAMAANPQSGQEYANIGSNVHTMLTNIKSSLESSASNDGRYSTAQIMVRKGSAPLHLLEKSTITVFGRG